MNFTALSELSVLTVSLQTTSILWFLKTRLKTDFLSEGNSYGDDNTWNLVGFTGRKQMKNSNKTKVTAKEYWFSGWMIFAWFNIFLFMLVNATFKIIPPPVGSILVGVDERLNVVFLFLISISSCLHVIMIENKKAKF